MDGTGSSEGVALQASRGFFAGRSEVDEADGLGRTRDGAFARSVFRQFDGRGGWLS